MRNFLLVALGFALWSLPSSLLAAPVAKEIKIGFVTDLSGFASYWGLQSQLGARIAEEELNQAGPGKISIIFGDHHLETKTAVTEVQRMLALDHVDALYVEFAPTAVAASPVVKNAKKLFLCEPPLKSVRESNPYAFTAYLDYEKGCFQIASYWKSLGLKRVGMVKAEAEFAELCLAGARKVYPDLEIAGFKIGEEQSSQILLMKQKSVEAILAPGFEGDMLNTLKAMSNLKVRLPVGNTEPDAITSEVKKQYGDALEGVVTFGFPPISNGFLAKVKLKDPGNKGVAMEAAAMAYLHVRQLVRAIQSCGSDELACHVREMERSPADETMLFGHFDNRSASYDFRLNVWHDGKQKVIKTYQ